MTTPLILSVTLQHQQGVGGGLLFNLPMPDSKNGGHMVRYVDAGDVIAWGYFDANGVFTGQGSAAAPLAGEAAHTLTVRVDSAAYTISLDDSVLASDISLNSPISSAYIGLTSSQSAVAFQEVRVLAPSATTIDTEAATGTWTVEGNQITQTDAESTDYVAGTGLAGERFTISADITLPADNPGAGAGILFHMSGRDDRRLGYMVRFGSGGSELFWGQYDTEGIFSGAGGIPLTLTEQPAHTLLLTVRAGSFDIHVDGAALVTDIPIERGGGWIGLLSFSGPVIFSNVNLQLGQ